MDWLRFRGFLQIPLTPSKLWCSGGSHVASTGLVAGVMNWMSHLFTERFWYLSHRMQSANSTLFNLWVVGSCLLHALPRSPGAKSLNWKKSTGGGTDDAASHLMVVWLWTQGPTLRNSFYSADFGMHTIRWLDIGFATCGMIQIAEKSAFSRNIFSTLLVLTGKTMATACVWVWCLSDPEWHVMIQLIQWLVGYKAWCYHYLFDTLGGYFTS